MNGWGDKTVLTKLFFEMTGGKSPFEYFYGESFRHIPMHMKVSGFTRQVEQACKLNDTAAIKIVTDAGNYLALQTIALFEKYDIPQDVDIVLSGGAWKTDYRIKQKFTEIVGKELPNAPIITPILEPVAGGAIYHAGGINQAILNNFREV